MIIISNYSSAWLIVRIAQSPQMSVRKKKVNWQRALGSTCGPFDLHEAWDWGYPTRVYLFRMWQWGFRAFHSFHSCSISETFKHHHLCYYALFSVFSMLRNLFKAPTQTRENEMFENLLNLQIYLMLFWGIRYLKPIWGKQIILFFFQFCCSLLWCFLSTSNFSFFVASLLLLNTCIKVYLKLFYIVFGMFFCPCLHFTLLQYISLSSRGTYNVSLCSSIICI